jgi:exosortase K
VGLVLAAGAKAAYARLGPDEMRLLTGPTQALVGLLTGIDFTYEGGYGYVSFARHLVIAKSCTGVNFLLAAFGLLGFTLVPAARGWRTKLALVPAVAGLAFAATVVVNAVRISVGVALHDAGACWGWMDAGRVHRLAGIVVYFGSLLALHALARRGPVSSLIAAPLAWYAAIAVAVPLLNGALAARPLLFAEHCAWIAVVALLVGLAACGKDKVVAPASSIAITQPTSASRYDTFMREVRIGGTISAAGTVRWNNSATAATGVATVDASHGTWFADIAELAPIDNRITVEAIPDAPGGRSSVAVIVVLYDPHLDHVPPVITITVPTSQDTFTTVQDPVVMRGNATDNSNQLDVLWRNADFPTHNGIAVGRQPWEASIDLESGENLVVVTARDFGGNTASDTALVILIESSSEGGPVALKRERRRPHERPAPH